MGPTTVESLLTITGVAGATGIPEPIIRAAIAVGKIKHDVIAWAGWSAIALFYPSSVERVRHALTTKTNQPTAA